MHARNSMYTPVSHQSRHIVSGLGFNQICLTALLIQNTMERCPTIVLGASTVLIQDRVMVHPGVIDYISTSAPSCLR